MNDRRSSASLMLEPPKSELPARVLYHGLRWLPLAAVAVLTYLLYPAPGGFDAPLLDEGEVAPAEVLAPFTFVVRKSPSEITREADALAATVRPIYEYRPAVTDSVLAHALAFFTALDRAATGPALADSAQRHGIRLASEGVDVLLDARQRRALRDAVLRTLQTTLPRGVTSPAASQGETAREIVVRREASERVVARDSILSYTRFLDARNAVRPPAMSAAADGVFVKILNGLFRPTLQPAVQETEALRAELRASVDSVKDTVRANERIVAAHDVVTDDVRERLAALRSELARRGAAGGVPARAAIGQILTNALTLSIFWLLLMLYRRETYAERRQMLVVGLLFGLVVLGAAANFSYITPAPELIPIPFAAMLITVLFSGRVAMIAAAVLAVLIGSQSVYGGHEALYIALIGGVAAALGMRMVRRRTQLLSTMAVITAAYAVAAVTLGLQLGQPITVVGQGVAIGTVNAVVSAALVSFALPIFESFAQVTTDLTLLELSDPSRPLLRRLATEAPGTYAHSIAMANLCEAACNAIGANGLLARVGCYHHDVGKLKKPQYFVENQRPGENPHDKLKPEVSAGIIRNHIKEGLALAEEHGLPPVVKAFIPEHHGTAEITYFLDRARKRGAGEEELEGGQWRYPGPRPQSVETAVAMLADGVEAALRVLDDPSPQKVRDAIDHMVDQRVASGQLNEAPLTLAQLDRVKQEFVRVLTGVHHARIDYPAETGGLSAEWDARARA